MKSISIVSAVILSLAAAEVRAAEPAPVSEDEQALYVIGQQIGQGLVKFHLTAKEIAILQRGLRDALSAATPAVDEEAFGQKRLDQFASAREKAGVQLEHERGRVFAERAAREKGAIALPSGLVFKELQPGTSKQAGPDDYLRVQVRGRLIDGRIFDDSHKRNQPLRVQIQPRFMPCWTEALKRMNEGGKARVVCPAAMAFGDALGRPPLVPPGATVVYDVELVEIMRDAGR